MIKLQLLKNELLSEILYYLGNTKHSIRIFKSLKKNFDLKKIKKFVL
jgi:hypothetical protein